MSVSLPSLRSPRSVFSAGLMMVTVAGFATVRGRAADMSGEYADGGTIIAVESSASATEPSLHALLRLQFDPAVAGVLRDQTSHITIKHGGGLLEVEAHDTENNVSWRRRWSEGFDYVQRGSRVILRFRLEGSGSDEIVLMLEPIAPHGLLQLSAQRITPTLLGPVARPLGTYLFHCMP